MTKSRAERFLENFFKEAYITAEPETFLNRLELIVKDAQQPTSDNNKRSRSANSQLLSIPNRGIPNTGNTCYIASVIQCLIRYPGFVNALNTNLYPSDEFTQQFRSLIYAYLSSYVVDVTAFANVLPRIGSFQVNLQEDASQLLMSISNNLSGGLGTHLKKLTSFEERTIITNCPNCNYQATPPPEISSGFLSVSLLNQEATVSRTLLNHYAPKNFVGECGSGRSSCGQVTRKEHRCMRSLPEVLVIHLKRFEVQGERQVTLKKNNTQILVEEFIDVKAFKCEPSNESHPYELFAVINHEGKINNGHYSAMCRTSEGWKTFNCGTVTNFNPQFEYRSMSPYLLFYKKRRVSITA